MRIELRRAIVADAAAIARIHLRARAAAGTAFPPSVHEDDEFLPHLLRDVLPHAEVWLATADGVPAGYLVLDGRDLLEDLFVSPETQGAGVGTALLDHAMARRPDGLTLWVFTSNLPARAFYDRHGLEVIGGTDDDNEERAPDLLMRWAGAEEVVSPGR